MLKEIIDVQGINATLTDHNGMTALHWAVAVNAMPVAIRLLRRFPQLMEKCTHKGETILHIMCREGHDNLLHVIMCTFPTAYLLVNHRDCEERTAKELAEQLQNQECLQFLQTNQQPTVWLQGFLQQRCIDRYTHTHTSTRAYIQTHPHRHTHTHPLTQACNCRGVQLEQVAELQETQKPDVKIKGDTQEEKQEAARKWRREYMRQLRRLNRLEEAALEHRVGWESTGFGILSFVFARASKSPQIRSLFAKF